MSTHPFSRRALRRTGLLAGATLSSLALVTVPSAPAAFAAAGEVDIVNTETVQVYVDSDGTIDSRRVYEQLTLTGQGSAQVANPIEEDGLRNLDGFSGFEVEDGVQSMEVDVDGVERLRTVSDYTGDLPLEVSTEYRLDGELVEPDDVVGADGALEVTYKVRNVTSAPQEITYPDGNGGTVTETAEVPIPIVGSLTTVAPASFTQVESGQANLAGDGKGGTKLSFTMTLFPPLGSDEVEFGYTADITDGVVPGASISALPVNPLESPTFATAGNSYKSGAETGEKLAEGATEIDSNLLRLRDGAADLLGGLIQLSDGADQLNAGLAGEAAPGAQELASGALRLDDGLGQLSDGAGELSDGTQRLRLGAGDLDDGANQLSDGAGQLSEGAGAALTGSEQLEDGLKRISDGLGQLSASEGLPKALRGSKDLKAGVDEIITKVGTTEIDGTLLGGLHDLETGLVDAETGSASLRDGLHVLVGNVPTESAGLRGAKGGVDQVQTGLAEAVKPGGSLDQLIGGLESLTAFCDADEPACAPTISALVTGATESKSQLSLANAGLLEVSAGLGKAIGSLDALLIPGATKLNAGISTAKTGATKLKAGAGDLRDGLVLVQGGLGSLVTGLTDAVSGVSQLSDGASDAHTGSGDLADGLARLDVGAGDLADGAGRLADGTGDLRDGAGELADGAGRLADGAGDAKDGSGQIADGAGRLSEGLGDAADGSGRLAGGLDQAEEGAPQLVDGAGRLSDEGMSQLIEAGEATAQDYGKLYAVIGAAGERAEAEKMAYGAPENAAGLTAYSFELMGNDGEGSRNLTRGITALVLLGAGLAALGLRRRFV